MNCGILVSGPSVKRDIVFLLDGSDDNKDRFTAMRDFVAGLVGGLDLDQGKDQVAVVQYSNNAEVNFNLNTYQTRDEIMTYITNLKRKGGTAQYIGTALQFVRNNIFVSKAGSRQDEGAKQILVLISGGRSRDSPRGPASALKTAGVITFAIGSRMTNVVEMRGISSDPNNAFLVSDFANLASIQQTLVSHIRRISSQKETAPGKILTFCIIYYIQQILSI